MEDSTSVIVALERSALDRWGVGDPSGFLEICASDVVYFDPYVERRINGLAELTRYYEALRGTIRVSRYELLDPCVQLAGETAVLTFNYVSEDGSNGGRWNCTEVYRRGAEGWRIIQTHWSRTAALAS